MMPMTLHDYIYKNEMSDKTIKIVIFQLLRGLAYLK